MIPLETLIQAARQGAIAAQHCMESPAGFEDLKFQDKGGGDFATSADLASQEAILGFLKANLDEPLRDSLPIIAEEQDSHADQMPASFLTVDPLDGTIIFSRRCREWGSLVGHVEDGQLVAGVMVQPQLNRIIAAGSEGAFISELNGGSTSNLCLASADGDTDNKRSVVGIDINMVTADRDLTPFVKKLLDNQQILVVRSLGAAIAAAAEILLGQIDIYFNPVGGKIWDFAPCAHVINAAGGGALELDLNNRVAKPFTPSHLRYGVLFASSPKLARETATTLGFQILGD